MSFPDDISELWGSEHEGALTPAPAENNVPHPVDRVGANGSAGNGSAVANMDHAIHSDVARLAEAIASDQVRRADLEALRTEFSHQLGVALYELVSVSNTRLASAEDHINERVAALVQAHTDHLATALEASNRNAIELAHTVRAEIDALRELLAAPVEALVALQRDLGEEARRLREETASQAMQAAQRFDTDAEGRRRLELQVARTEGEVGDIAGTLAAIKDEVSEIRQEMTILRDEVETQSRRSRRWGRAR